jgi:uncharacterized membrane protein (DUF373 family)
MLILYQGGSIVSSHQKPPADPKLEAHKARMEKRDHRVEHVFRRILHFLEQAIAVMTIVVLLGALGIEVYHMVTDSGYFEDVSHFLHNVLTIVVGLEFVRMLIDTTPASILEVLTVAITRHVILSHDDYWSNVACVACIAGLFAIRRFLIRRSELKEELVEND